MNRSDDNSAFHFEWLVAGRSRNQKATLDLYKIIVAHEALLYRDVEFRNIAEELVAITFSLWRAVFLSDLTGEIEDRLVDLRRFLQSLIAHNAVLYQTDFTAREWTFRYYLLNAIFRLTVLPEGVMPENVAASSGTAKDQWTNAQMALERAIERFAEMASAGAAQ